MVQNDGPEVYRGNIHDCFGVGEPMNRDRRALMLGLGAVLCWSTVATAFKIALSWLDVHQLLLIASAVSATVLLLVVLWRGQGQLLVQYLREAPGYFLAVALLNPVLYYQVLFSAYDLLPAQQAQAINYTWAIALALMAVPLLGQRLHARDILAALAGYGGVVVIATQGDILSLQFSSVRGVGLALFSTVIWACYWIVNTRNQREPAVSLCLNFLLAVPFCLALSLWLSPPGLPHWKGLLAGAYVGLFEMGITFLLWTAALKNARRVALVGNLIFFAPFMSLVFIRLILGESIHWATLAGLCLIVPAALYQQMQRAERGG